MDETDWRAALGRPELWRWLGVAAVVLAAVWLARRLFHKPVASPHLERRRCACGWTGEVSKYRPICPQCGASLKA